MQEKSKVILITGASSGIGEMLAIKLAQEGYKIVLTARSSEKLEQITSLINSSGGDAAYYTVDLNSQSEVEKLIYILHDTYQGVDILINNAGLGWYGQFVNMPWNDAQAILYTNMMAVVRLTHAFLPGMIARDSGQIINISSIVGDLPIQGAVLYSSSKSFLNAFSKSLGREVSRTNVQVKLIKPGPVSTNFFNHTEEGEGRRIPGENWAITCEKATDCIVKAIHGKRRLIYIPGYYFFMPLIDLLFGTIIDRLGPILLGVNKKKGTNLVVPKGSM